MMKMILTQLNRISADSDYDIIGTCINLTINDFEGFDSNWNEVYREYVNADAVEEVLKWLEENADSVEDDLYHRYHFGEIMVEVDYISFDI